MVLFSGLLFGSMFTNRIGISEAPPGTRSGRNPTTGKQYFPGSGNQPGIAKEKTTGGRTRPAQEKKPGFWNGDVNLYLRV